MSTALSTHATSKLRSKLLACVRCGTKSTKYDDGPNDDDNLEQQFVANVQAASQSAGQQPSTVTMTPTSAPQQDKAASAQQPQVDTKASSSADSLICDPGVTTPSKVNAPAPTVLTPTPVTPTAASIPITPFTPTAAAAAASLISPSNAFTTPPPTPASLATQSPVELKGDHTQPPSSDTLTSSNPSFTPSYTAPAPVNITSPSTPAATSPIQAAPSPSPPLQPLLPQQVEPASSSTPSHLAQQPETEVPPIEGTPSTFLAAASPLALQVEDDIKPPLTPVTLSRGGVDDTLIIIKAITTALPTSPDDDIALNNTDRDNPIKDFTNLHPTTDDPTALVETITKTANKITTAIDAMMIKNNDNTSVHDITVDTTNTITKDMATADANASTTDGTPARQNMALSTITAAYCAVGAATGIGMGIWGCIISPAAQTCYMHTLGRLMGQSPSNCTVETSAA